MEISEGSQTSMVTRFLPFILFKGNKSKNSYISYIGQVLPYAAIGMLVVYMVLVQAVF